MLCSVTEVRSVSAATEVGLVLSDLLGSIECGGSDATELSNTGPSASSLSPLTPGEAPSLKATAL